VDSKTLKSQNAASIQEKVFISKLPFWSPAFQEIANAVSRFVQCVLQLIADF
jgi:hypothetical protein